MQNAPVRQHWVPKTYLRGFCADSQDRGQIHTCDLTTGKRFLASLDRVAVQKHLYTLDQNSEHPSYAVEEALSRLETEATILLTDIRSSEELPTETAATAVLARFVAVLHMRTRQGLQMVEGLRNEVCRDGDPFQVDRQGDLANALGSLKSEGVRELFARAVVVVGERIATHVKTMHWRLLRAESGYFVTSENPVISFHRTSERWGIGTPGVHVLFPISPTLMLFMANEKVLQGEGTKVARAEAVKGLNGMIVLAAEQYLYSHRPFDGIADLIEARQGGRAFGPVI